MCASVLVVVGGKKLTINGRADAFAGVIAKGGGEIRSGINVDLLPHFGTLLDPFALIA